MSNEDNQLIKDYSDSTNICEKIINDMDFNSYHIKLILLLNLYIGGEGLLMVGNSLLTPIIGNVWQLSEFEKGFIGGTIFLGFTLGALFSGVISDNKGRKVSFLLGNIISLIGSIIGCIATLSSHLCVSNFLIGIGLGQSVPSIFSLCSESMGEKFRNFVINITFISFVIGEILICLVAKRYKIYIINTDYWRILLYLRVFTVI